MKQPETLLPIYKPKNDGVMDWDLKAHKVTKGMNRTVFSCLGIPH